MSKTITLTWRSDKLRGKQCLSRFRLPDLEFSGFETDLEYALYHFDWFLNSRLHFVGLRPSCWRVSRAGKLIVRMATYQGV